MKNGGLKFSGQLIALLLGLWMGVTGIWLLQDNLTELFPGLAKWLWFGYEADDSVYYCVVAFDSAERIGETWEGIEAEDGYSFYKLQYTVTNMGDRYYYADCPYLLYTGDDYDDVLDYWDWNTQETEENTSPFASYEASCVPVGRTAAAYEVVQVRDGVTEFTVSYYPNYEDATQKVILTITLE